MKRTILTFVLCGLIPAAVPAQTTVFAGFGSVDAGAVTGQPLDPAIDIAVVRDLGPRWSVEGRLRKERLDHSDGIFLDASLQRRFPWRLKSTVVAMAGASYGIGTIAYGGFEWTTDEVGRTVHQRWRSISQNGGFVFAGPDSNLEAPTVIYPFLGVALERPVLWRFRARLEVRVGIVQSVTADATFDPRIDRLMVFTDERSLAVMPSYRFALGWRF